MSKVRFNLKDKRQERTLIPAIYRFNNRRIVLSTGHSIAPKDWNDRLMRVRETADILDSEVTNIDLDRLESRIKAVHNGFRKNGITPTTEQFKAALAEGTPINSGNDVPTVLGFIDSFIQERKSSAKHSMGSIQVYNTTHKHFRVFCGKRRIEFTDLTRDFLAQFILYLYRLNFEDNHVNKVFGTLRTMLNDAVERGYTNNLAYKSRKLSVPKHTADSVYLDKNELLCLKQLDLSDSPRLAKVRDLFLVGCYTGLRYSDFSRLTLDNVVVLNGTSFIQAYTKKTNDKIIVPIHPAVQAIIERYGGFPPSMCNQRMNQYLKELMQRFIPNAEVTVRSYKGGKQREVKRFKWQLITTHTARRSFATNAYLQGVPVLDIMKITGHTKYETFQKYIRIDKLQNAQVLSQHEFFRSPASGPTDAPRDDLAIRLIRGRAS